MDDIHIRVPRTDSRFMAPPPDLPPPHIEKDDPTPCLHECGQSSQCGEARAQPTTSSAQVLPVLVRATGSPKTNHPPSYRWRSVQAQSATGYCFGRLSSLEQWARSNGSHP